MLVAYTTLQTSPFLKFEKGLLSFYIGSFCPLFELPVVDLAPDSIPPPQPTIISNTAQNPQPSGRRQPRQVVQVTSKDAPTQFLLCGLPSPSR